jgi:hypothetical protein
MSTVTGYESAASGSREARDLTHSPGATGTEPHRLIIWRCYSGAAALALAVLFIALPNAGLNEIAQLERLASRIERAPMLSGEAKTAIDRLLARQSAFAGAGEGSLQARRKTVIERVNQALSAKQPGSVGQSGLRAAAD